MHVLAIRSAQAATGAVAASLLSSFGWRSISRSGSPSGMISHSQPYRDDGSASNRHFFCLSTPVADPKRTSSVPVATRVLVRKDEENAAL
jgi:hypothetical protein